MVGKFVEYFGDALAGLTLEDQATIANMPPEYGATCGFFPISQATVDFLTKSNREADRVALVEAYAKAQGLWFDAAHEPVFTDTLELDISTVQPSLAGPKRPQDRVAAVGRLEPNSARPCRVISARPVRRTSASPSKAADFDLGHGDVVIAAITSCTNTSNPAVLIAAGLVARKAHAKGLKVKPWVKTSLAPGSKVVTDYLTSSGLQTDLDAPGLQPGRLRLHHLHRQFRSAAGRHLGGHQRQRTGRLGGHFRQPQL